MVRLPPVVKIKDISKLTRIPLNAVVKVSNDILPQFNWISNRTLQHIPTGLLPKRGEKWLFLSSLVCCSSRLIIWISVKQFMMIYINYFQHNGTNYEFHRKSEILFPFDFAKKRLKRHLSENVEMECVDPEPQPFDLDEHDFSTESECRKQAVVAVMGHQDHGKTTLLDAIRGTNVAATESGAITQKVSCFHFGVNARSLLTWIDTPGHEVFFRMRSSSAVVADLVVVVVDVIEQIGPQTLEVIQKAKHLSVPLVVALNKIDKMLSPQEISLISRNSLDSFMSDNTHPLCVRIKNLREEIEDKLKGLEASKMMGTLGEWTHLDNRDTYPQQENLVFDTVAISAKEKLNLSELLLSVDVATGMLNPLSPRKVSPQCIVLETASDHWTLIVHCGVLRVGDLIVGGTVAGKVRKIKDAANGMDDVQYLLPGQAGAVYVDYSKYRSTNQLPTAGEVVFVMKQHRADKRMMPCLLEFVLFAIQNSMDAQCPSV